MTRAPNVRDVPPSCAVMVDGHGVEIIDVSYTGCRVRGPVAMTAGVVGLLTVQIDNQPHTELFRVCRGRAVEAGHGRVFESGIEFLPLVLSTPSIRDAIFRLAR